MFNTIDEDSPEFDAHIARRQERRRLAMERLRKIREKKLAAKLAAEGADPSQAKYTHADLWRDLNANSGARYFRRKRVTPMQHSLAAGAAAAPALDPVPVVDTPAAGASSSISAAKLAANRANAQKSSGPRTSEGKAKASLNSVKTGLTGLTVILPTEDVAVYLKHVQTVNERYKPYSPEEKRLAQAIADTEWRLDRIPSLEAGIYAIGLREFANDFEDETNLTNRGALIRAKIALHYRKDLSNLALQERRLRNHREKDIAELLNIQKQRAEVRARQCVHARTLLKLNEGVELFDVGFDFTTGEFELYEKSNYPLSSTMGHHLGLDEFLVDWRKEQRAA